MRGAAGGSGCATRLSTVKPKASVAVASTIRGGGGVVEAIPTPRSRRIGESV